MLQRRLQHVPRLVRRLGGSLLHRRGRLGGDPGGDDPALLRLPLPGPGPGQPAGRGLHQWTPITQPHQAEDHRDGGGGGQAVCHQQAAEGQPWLRL